MNPKNNNNSTDNSNGTDAPRPSVNREIHLVSRPVGEPQPANFALVETEIPEPAEGQILVRNTWMSVDPYMRGRMNDDASYIVPFAIGAVLEGHAVGEVVASRSAEVAVGATVSHFAGWREYAVIDGAEATVLDVSTTRPQDHLGALGQVGFTAYLAVAEVAPVRPGDVVFVSGAAGAVGSLAGQIARNLGASRVIGSAGGPGKGRILTDVFGFDAAIDYRAGSIAEQLAKAAPEGIDVYVDNVGGDHLEAAIGAMRMHGRAAIVGMISGYNATEPVPGPSNLYDLVLRQLTLKGLLVVDHYDKFPAYLTQATTWLADGSLRTRETIVHGIDRAPEAFLGMLHGANTGKMLVRL
ncbi:NADP-dependent oxidoreductase [Embleya sp. NPDC059237]|uniref:NADP-dependent oxidoreductase n=1 Tax=Embleya sp. NPDC059237 TaxID=3346784 RepID=UPI0036B596CC